MIAARANRRSLYTDAADGPFGLLLLHRARGRLAGQRPRRPAACTISSIERMLSSLPGIGRSTSSGSQSVSIRATVVMPSLRASRTAFFSFRGSIDHQALGQAVHRADAVEVAIHLAVFAVQRRLHLLRVGRQISSRAAHALPALRAGSSRLRIVRKLVSVPPSQRSLTKGMPQRRPCCSIVSEACRFVPTNSTRLPPAATLLQILPGPQQAADRLADVDDVDQIAAGVDVRPHLGVPAAGAMAEMDPRFDQVLNQNSSQRKTPSKGTPAKSPPEGGASGVG